MMNTDVLFSHYMHGTGRPSGFSEMMATEHQTYPPDLVESWLGFFCSFYLVTKKDTKNEVRHVNLS